jgi:hypothetical protein
MVGRRPSARRLQVGMLSIAEEHRTAMNPKARLTMYGQEANPESFAICKADMLIKGTTSATSSSATLLPKTDIRTASPTTCYKAPKMPMLVLSHASHPRAVLTGAPRWALADIFVSYTRSDRAAANPWIRSGGTDGAKRTSAFIARAALKAIRPPPMMLFAPR